jgi:hypothetical protein
MMPAPRASPLLVRMWVSILVSAVVILWAPPRPVADGASALPATSEPGVGGVFLYGIFEDANLIRGADDFQARVQDLMARQFTTILFTNNVVDRDAPLLDVADKLNFQVIFAPQGDLRHLWWADDVSATIDNARRVIYPIAQRAGAHPSLLGYSILDDAPDKLAKKAALAVQAFREVDPGHPASPVFIANNDDVYRLSQPDAILTYDYPLVVSRRPCDLYSSDTRDRFDRIVSTVRHLGELGRHDGPVWMVLQAHGSVARYDPRATDPSALREPTIEEIRLQHWLALGEGVKGIFWFAYDTDQFWTGLRDNPLLFDEITALARRMRPLAGLLGRLSRVDDQFSVAAVGATAQHHGPHASTLVSGDGKLYTVAVNRSCEPAMLVITSSAVGGQLRDVEQDETYDLGTPIPFKGGDGRLFEVVDAVPLEAQRRL